MRGNHTLARDQHCCYRNKDEAKCTSSPMTAFQGTTEKNLAAGQCKDSQKPESSHQDVNPESW